ARVGRATVAVEVTNAVRASHNSFQLRWQEQSFEGGALIASKRFTGLFTLVIAQPRDEAMLRKNPLGIYITAFSWGQDLGGAGKGARSWFFAGLARLRAAPRDFRSKSPSPRPCLLKPRPRRQSRRRKSSRCRSRYRFPASSNLSPNRPLTKNQSR